MVPWPGGQHDPVGDTERVVTEGAIDDGVTNRALPTNSRSRTLEILSRAGEHPLMSSSDLDAIFTVDQHLRYLSVSGSGLAAVGLSRATLEGKTLLEVFPAETTNVALPSFREALAGRSSTIDVPFAGRVFSQHLTPIRDPSGKVVAAMGAVEDVTRARTASRVRSESEERFRHAFFHAPIGMAMVELDGRLRHVNAAFAKLMQYSENELHERLLQELTHPDDLDANREHVDRLLGGEVDSLTLEQRYVTRTASTVWVRLSATLARGPDGAPRHFIAQIQDITGHRRYEASVREMVAMLSHDLRAPISVVTGFAEILLDSWESLREDERRGFLLKTLAAAHSAQSLLENTLTMSALDDTGLTTSQSSVRVSDVVDEVLQGLALSSSIALRTSGDSTALVDRVHLIQIVTNLVTNALKYGAEPFVVEIHTETDSVLVEVADAGLGVPPEFQPHLFDRFTRSETSRSSRERGSGLGLHIARRLLLLNGGDIRYTPRPGGGAACSFNLPRAKPQLLQNRRKSRD